MKSFDDIRTSSARALQIYQILLGLAHNRQTTTYGKLAEILGFDGAGVFAVPLGHIMYWCAENELPPLTSLVVKQDTGLPGDGLTSPVDLHGEREQVFEYPWFKLYPPSPEELKAAFDRGSNASGTPKAHAARTAR